MNRKNRQDGFTLVEILVVIAIIGILSAIGFVALNGVRGRARDAIRVADMDQIGVALDLYSNNNNGAFPIADPAECLDGSDSVNTALEAEGISNGNISDPTFSTTPNCYLYQSDGASYSITYFLETDGIDTQGLHTLTSQ